MEAGKRMCQYCNRCFSNGKSLGGHMKSHLSLTYSKGTPGAGTSSNPQKKRRAPRSSSTGDDPFKCMDCGKGFLCLRSYWAHLRWHQLVQNNSNDNIDIGENASEDAKINLAAHMLVALSRMDCSCYYLPNYDVNIEEMKIRKHGCPVCQKVFPTGKALGGHKRSHVPAMPCGGKTRVLKEKQPELGFDLNVKPPEVTEQSFDANN